MLRLALCQALFFVSVKATGGDLPMLRCASSELLTGDPCTLTPCRLSADKRREREK